MASTDGLVRLFSNDVAPLRTIRGLGLGAVERIPSFKRMAIRHAMGTPGTLPRLLRGERSEENTFEPSNYCASRLPHFSCNKKKQKQSNSMQDIKNNITQT